MTFSHTTTLGEIAAAAPSSVAVFERHGLDFCCGGRATLADACRERGLDVDEIARELARATVVPAAAAGHDWTAEPLAALADHIIQTHHAPLREQLPGLEALAAKVVRVHGSKGPELGPLSRALGELSADLRMHMQKEERVLFPAIAALEEGRLPGAFSLETPIAVMEHEHDNAGALLAAMRELTGGYTVPSWGCGSVRALYGGLAAIEADMHVHVHLENNILFPRALALAGAPPAGPRS